MTDTDEDVRDHVCVHCGETKPEGYALTAGWSCTDCVQAFAESHTDEDEWGDHVEGPFECISCGETVPEGYDPDGSGSYWCLDCIRALNSEEEV